MATKYQRAELQRRPGQNFREGTAGRTALESARLTDKRKLGSPSLGGVEVEVEEVRVERDENGEMVEDEEDQFLSGLPVRVVEDGFEDNQLILPTVVDLGEFAWNTKSGQPVTASNVSAIIFSSTDEEDALQDHVGKSPGNWWQRPYVHVLFTSAAFQDSVKDKKSRVSEFMESCRKKGVEWLVVFTTRQPREESTGKGNRPLPAFRRLSKERDRLLTMAMGKDFTPDPNSWAEFAASLRDCIRDAVEAKVQAYEQEVNQVYTNRIMPGWSFNQYVSVQEGLAFLYQQIKRFDRSHSIYDELEKGRAEREDDDQTYSLESGSLLLDIINPRAKPYRHMISSNSIAPLELRTYLFSRRMCLFLEEGKSREVGEQGLEFITVVQARLAIEAEQDGSPAGVVFSHLWAFFAARSLAESLSRIVGLDSLAQLKDTQQAIQRRHVSKTVARLYELVLKEFRLLAAVFSPDMLPLESSDEKELTGLSVPLSIIPDEGLAAAFKERMEGIDMFAQLCLRTAEVYRIHGRSAYAARLLIKTGYQLLDAGADQAALALLSVPCVNFASTDGWHTIHWALRDKVATAEKRLGLLDDYLSSCVEMLRMTRQDRQLTESFAESLSAQSPRCFAEAKACAADITKPMEISLLKLFDVRVGQQSEPWIEGGSAAASVFIESAIPAELEFDGVTVELVRTRPDQVEPRVLLLESEGSGVTIKSGSNTVETKCGHVDAPGLYRLDKVVIRMNKLRLFIKYSEDPKSFEGTFLHFIVTPSSPLHVRLKPGQLMLLEDAENHVSIEMWAGPTGFRGEIEVRPTLVWPSGSEAPAGASVQVVVEGDREQPEPSGGSHKRQLNLEPGASENVGARVVVRNFEPSWLEDDNAAGADGIDHLDIVLSVKVEIRFEVEGRACALSRLCEQAVRIARPLSVRVAKGTQSGNKALVAIALRNETERASLTVFSTSLDPSDTAWKLDSAEPAHAELLPAKISSSGSMQLVFALMREGAEATANGGLKGRKVLLVLEIAEGEHSERDSAPISTIRCSLPVASLVNGIKGPKATELQVSRSLPKVAVVGSPLHLRFNIEETEARVFSKAREEGGDFMYHVMGNEDEWLVCGLRSGRLGGWGSQSPSVRWLQVVPLVCGILRSPEVSVTEISPENGRTRHLTVGYTDNIAQIYVLPPQSTIATCERQYVRQSIQLTEPDVS